jgi:cytochrome P450
LAGIEIAHLNQGFDALAQAMTRRLFSIIKWPLFIPTSNNRIFNWAVDILQHEIAGIVANRQQEPADSQRPVDLLDMLIDSFAEQGALSFTDLVSEITAVIFAGHGTTALTLTFAFYLLSQHPVVAHKLDDELKQVLNGRSPTMDDLSTLPYTRMVVQETMRLYPQGWSINRELAESDTLGDEPLAEGTSININVWGMHRHPDRWEKPDQFYPEHFLPEAEKRRHNYAYIPFGRRRCAGWSALECVEIDVGGVNLRCPSDISKVETPQRGVSTGYLLAAWTG